MCETSAPTITLEDNLDLEDTVVFPEITREPIKKKAASKDDEDPQLFKFKQAEVRNHIII